MKSEIKTETRKIGRVQKAREEKSLKRRKLAEMANMSAGTIQRIEEGRTNFRITTLARIAWALKVKLSDLWPD